MNLILRNAARRLAGILPERLLKFLRYGLLDGWAIKSYSQEGEDMILRRYFDKQSIGFFVDVGAHHPKRFSNTFFFYKRGWRGVNIDAMPGSMQIFRRVRRRDINVEAAISEIDHELTYYRFNEPALNGFSLELSKRRCAEDAGYEILGTDLIKTKRLDSLLRELLPADQQIDFMSIDVEGLDLSVLRSNDWLAFRPKLIVVEVIGQSLDTILESEVCEFLNSVGYAIYAKCIQSVIFEEQDARMERLGRENDVA